MIHSEWKTVDGKGDIIAATYKIAVGISRCIVVKLPENRFLVFSPCKELTTDDKALFDPNAQIILIAPSLAHTLGIKIWSAAFNNVSLAAADVAKSRISKLTSISEFMDLSELQKSLPANVAIHEPPGCRNGELWLSVEHGETTYWIVCDAIFNVTKLNGNFIARWLKRLYGLGNGLSIHKLLWSGSQNKTNFRDWAIEQFANHGKNILIPCHGDIYTNDDFTDQITEALQRRFK